MSKLVSLGSPRMAITSCLVIPLSTFLFPLAEAERHTANINIVVTMSAITSFLFISDTVFESYNLEPLLKRVLGHYLVYACESTYKKCLREE